MFLYLITILSAIIALIIYFVCFETVGQLFWIPVAFVICFIGLLLLWTASLFICTLFVNKNKPCRKRSRLFSFYADCLINSSIQISRVKLHVFGIDKLPKEKFLLVGNHISFMDPVITMRVLRSYDLGFVGASDTIFKNSVMARLLHKNFCIPINRESARDGVKMANEAAEIIKSGQASIGIYPEGKRNFDKELLPFRNGAFKIAKKAECPIVVAVIKNVEKIKKNFPFKKTHVYLDFASVIQPCEFVGLSTKEIGERVRLIMERALN